jgi:hypothetical protein
MSEKSASCCGPADEAATEATAEPAKPAVQATGRATDAMVAAHDPRSPERGTSGLIQAVRRLFGHVPA